MTDRDETLSDLGELRVIDEIVMPLARLYDGETDVGDDCAYFKVEDGLVAITTDVGPRPLLSSLPGYYEDQEAAGWLSVVACTSDIATAAAKPLFIANCIDAPPSLAVKSFEAFLRGYFKAGHEFGFRNGGGDVRHGPNLSIRVFAAGISVGGTKIRRSGGCPGDMLAVIGPTGQMMSQYLYCREQLKRDRGFHLDEARLSILRYPRPQIRQMMQLAEACALKGSSDTSDGLLGAIDNIMRASECGAVLRLSDEMLPKYVVEASDLTGVNPWNIAFCWGDWAVVVVVAADLRSAFLDRCAECGIQSVILGELHGSSGDLSVEYSGRTFRGNVLRNENFRSYGYNAGLDGHLHYMLSTPIF
jgi:thiamine-monophosphate kinase